MSEDNGETTTRRDSEGSYQPGDYTRLGEPAVGRTRQPVRQSPPWRLRSTAVLRTHSRAFTCRGASCVFQEDLPPAHIPFRRGRRAATPATPIQTRTRGTDAASIDGDPNCSLMETCTTVLPFQAFEETNANLFDCATGEASVGTAWSLAGSTVRPFSQTCRRSSPERRERGHSLLSPSPMVVAGGRRAVAIACSSGSR